MDSYKHALQRLLKIARNETDPDDGGFDNGMAIDNVSITLTLVPEPTTVFGGFLAACVLIYHQRRRFSRLLKRA